MSEYILYSHGNSANDKAIHNKVMELMKPDKTDIIIIPSGTESIQYFAKLKYHYQKLGFKKIDTIDFDYDANTDDHILADYNTFHLSAGNPIHAFSQLIKSGVIDTLYRQAISEKTFIGNSGGSMWLTCNLSLFRLVNNDLYKVAN